MGADQAADARSVEARAQAASGFSRDHQCVALSGALRLRLGDAAGAFRPVANGLLVVPPLDAPLSVSDHPRFVSDARPGSGGTRGEPVGRCDGQPERQGAVGQSKRLRCGKEDPWPQAPHRRGYGRTAFNGQSYNG